MGDQTVTRAEALREALYWLLDASASIKAAPVECKECGHHSYPDQDQWKAKQLKDKIEGAIARIESALSFLEKNELDGEVELETERR